MHLWSAVGTGRTGHCVRAVGGFREGEVGSSLPSLFATSSQIMLKRQLTTPCSWRAGCGGGYTAMVVTVAD